MQRDNPDGLRQGPATADMTVIVVAMRQCVQALASFSGEATVPARTELLSLAEEIIRGVLFVASWCDDELLELSQLECAIKETKTELTQTQNRRHELKQSLHLVNEDIHAIGRELELLEQVRSHEHLRERLAAQLPERRAYLEVLTEMGGRAKGEEGRLKDLERECVLLLENMEQIFRKTLNGEEEQWQTRENKAFGSPQRSL